jgi:hypothetical protein
MFRLLSESNFKDKEENAEQAKCFCHLFSRKGFEPRRSTVCEREELYTGGRSRCAERKEDGGGERGKLRYKRTQRTTAGVVFS